MEDIFIYSIYTLIGMLVAVITAPLNIGNDKGFERYLGVTLLWPLIVGFLIYQAFLWYRCAWSHYLLLKNKQKLNELNSNIVKVEDLDTLALEKINKKINYHFYYIHEHAYKIENLLRKPV